MREQQLLLEAIRGYLSDSAKLGLDTHADKKESSHYQWHQWESIDDMFALKASNSPFYESLCQAFYSVHSHKYLEDPTFGLSVDVELRSQGIPQEQREQAIKYIEEIKQEMSGEHKWSERDAGWNPNMDEIADMTKNADTRGTVPSDPYVGGGPAPSEDELKQFKTIK